MRWMHRQTGTMVKVLAESDERLLIVHPANGRELWVPKELYAKPPRCLAERDARWRKQARRYWWLYEQRIAKRTASEAELKEAVRRGEIPFLMVKDVLFPLHESNLAEKLYAEMKAEKKPYLKKQIWLEMGRRCKYWHLKEFDGGFKAELKKMANEWKLNERLLERELERR